MLRLHDWFRWFTWHMYAGCASMQGEDQTGAAFVLWCWGLVFQLTNSNLLVIALLWHATIFYRVSSYQFQFLLGQTAVCYAGCGIQRNKEEGSTCRTSLFLWSHHTGFHVELSVFPSHLTHYTLNHMQVERKKGGHDTRQGSVLSTFMANAIHDKTSRKAAASGKQLKKGK